MGVPTPATIRAKDRKTFDERSVGHRDVAHNIHERWILRLSIRSRKGFRRSVVHQQIHAIDMSRFSVECVIEERLTPLLRDSERISRITRGPSSSKEIVIPRAAKLESPLLLRPVFLPVSYSLLIKKTGHTCPVNYFLLLVES